MTDKKIVNFRIKDLPPEVQGMVEQRTNLIKGLMRKTVDQIIEVGGYLKDVKGALNHGQFAAWLDQEFQWKERTAERYMNVAERFKSVTVTDLYVAANALYLLSAPSTPQKAVNEALRRGKLGERITYQTAKTIVNGHQNKAAAKDGSAIPLSGSISPTAATATSRSLYVSHAQDIGTANPEWWDRWNARKERTPEIVEFVMLGNPEPGTIWLAFGSDAVRVARIIGCPVQKFGLPGDALPDREIVKLLVTDPKPDWWEGLYQALETNMDSYPEHDQMLWGMAGTLIWSTPGSAGALGGETAPATPLVIDGEVVEASTPAPAPTALSTEGLPIPGLGSRPIVTAPGGPLPGMPFQMPTSSNGTSGATSTSDQELAPGVPPVPNSLTITTEPPAAPASTGDPILDLIGGVLNLTDEIQNLIRESRARMVTDEQRATHLWIQRTSNVLIETLAELKLRKYLDRPARVTEWYTRLADCEDLETLRKIHGAMYVLKLGHDDVDLKLITEMETEYQATFNRLKAQTPEEDAA